MQPENMKLLAFVVAALAVTAVAIGGCTQAQLDAMQGKIDMFETDAKATVAFFRPLVVSACKGASTASAAALEVMGSDSTVTILTSYVNESCKTAAAIDKLAANPDSLTYLGKLEGSLKVLAKR